MKQPEQDRLDAARTLDGDLEFSGSTTEQHAGCDVPASATAHFLNNPSRHAGVAI
jgi:hypothetical protein